MRSIPSLASQRSGLTRSYLTPPSGRKTADEIRSGERSALSVEFFSLEERETSASAKCPGRPCGLGRGSTEGILFTSPGRGSSTRYGFYVLVGAVAMWPFGSKREFGTTPRRSSTRFIPLRLQAPWHLPRKLLPWKLESGCFRTSSRPRKLEGPLPVVSAVEKIGLGAMARDLLLRGECSYWIQTTVGGGVRLTSGIYRGRSLEVLTRTTWAFKVSANRTQLSLRTELPESQLLRPVYSTDPARPWESVGPLQRAGVSASLLGKLESAFAQESGTTVGDRPCPWIIRSTTGQRREKAPRRRLAEDFKNLRGRLSLFLAHPNTRPGRPRRETCPEAIYNRSSSGRATTSLLRRCGRRSARMRSRLSE